MFRHDETAARLEYAENLRNQRRLVVDVGIRELIAHIVEAGRSERQRGAVTVHPRHGWAPRPRDLEHAGETIEADHAQVWERGSIRGELFPRSAADIQHRRARPAPLGIFGEETDQVRIDFMIAQRLVEEMRDPVVVQPVHQLSHGSRGPGASAAPRSAPRGFHQARHCGLSSHPAPAITTGPAGAATVSPAPSRIALVTTLMRAAGTVVSCRHRNPAGGVS